MADPVQMVSANTEDLESFDLRGVAYLDRLVSILDRTREQRYAALAALGDGPADISSSALEELIVNTANTNNFVHDIRLDLDQGLAPAPLDVELVTGVISGQLDAGEVVAAQVPTADLDAVQDWLDADWRGVTEHDLNRIRDLLEDRDGWQVDWILGQLTDTEMQRLVSNVDSTGFFSNDWSEETRNDFYAMVGEKVSLETWWRLGAYTERINPNPAAAMPDSARDNPTSQAKYERLEYALFDQVIATAGPGQHRLGLDDMKQGSIGDCYFIAAMIALADRDPELLENTMHRNPNGTFTVTFADGSRQVVSPDFVVDPTDRTATPAFARPGPGAEGGEIWFMVLEKAYAQRNQGWGEIVGGSQSRAIEDLTGMNAEWVDNDDIDIVELAERFDSGEILGLSTIDKPDDVDLATWRTDPNTPDTFKFSGTGDAVPPLLYQNHAFVVVDVDAAAGTVSVINPWTPDMVPVQLTEAQLRESVNGVYRNEAKK